MFLHVLCAGAVGLRVDTLTSSYIKAFYCILLGNLFLFLISVSLFCNLLHYFVLFEEFTHDFRAILITQNRVIWAIFDFFILCNYLVFFGYLLLFLLYLTDVLSLLLVLLFLVFLLVYLVSVVLLIRLCTLIDFIIHYMYLLFSDHFVVMLLQCIKLRFLISDSILNTELGSWSELLNRLLINSWKINLFCPVYWHLKHFLACFISLYLNECLNWLCKTLAIGA